MDLSAMMNYEISLWEEYISSEEKDKKLERKICILGSNEFKSNINIFEPIFTKKVDGANTLTFSIFAKSLDEDTNNYVSNPLVQLLHNESKIKLKYSYTILPLVITPFECSNVQPYGI